MTNYIGMGIVLFLFLLSIYLAVSTMNNISNHTTFDDEQKICQKYGNLKLQDVPSKCRGYYEY